MTRKKHLQFWEAAEQEMRRLQREADSIKFGDEDGIISERPDDKPQH